MAIVEGFDVDFLADTLSPAGAAAQFEAGNFSEVVFEAITQARSEIFGPSIEGPAAPPLPRFNVGQFVFFHDGRASRITRRYYDQDVEVWLYDLADFTGAYDESQLLAADPFPTPIIATEREPRGAGDLVTLSDLGLAIEVLRQNLEGQLLNLRSDLSDDISQVGRDAARELREFNLQEISVVVDSIFELRELTDTRFADSQTLIDTELAGFRERLDGLEDMSISAAGVGFGSLLGGLGALYQSPLSWFLDKAGDAILEEIIDGLNR